MPRPVHGASNKTRSKVLGNIYGYFLPSLQVTTVLVMPNLQILNCNAFNLSFLRSLAKIDPVFFIICAMYEVLPPGADAISNIF